MAEYRNIQLKYRFGSPTSYLSAALRCPKLIILLESGNNPHASAQLRRFIPVPSLALHMTLQSSGKGGTSSARLGPVFNPAEVLNVETYVSFQSSDVSVDGGDRIDILSSLGGNSIVPSHCPDIILDVRDAFATA